MVRTHHGSPIYLFKINKLQKSHKRHWLGDFEILPAIHQFGAIRSGSISTKQRLGDLRLRSFKRPNSNIMLRDYLRIPPKVLYVFTSAGHNLPAVMIP